MSRCRQCLCHYSHCQKRETKVQQVQFLEWKGLFTSLQSAWWPPTNQYSNLVQLVIDLLTTFIICCTYKCKQSTDAGQSVLQSWSLRMWRINSEDRQETVCSQLSHLSCEEQETEWMSETTADEASLKGRLQFLEKPAAVFLGAVWCTFTHITNWLSLSVSSTSLLWWAENPSPVTENGVKETTRQEFTSKTSKK